MNSPAKLRRYSVSVTAKLNRGCTKRKSKASTLRPAEGVAAPDQGRKTATTTAAW